MPEKLGGFELAEKVSTGPTGEVYRAIQPSMGREVAVKMLSPRLSKDAGYVRKFQDTAKAAAALNHPNLVQVIDVGHAEGRYYIAMEYVQGANLQTLMDTQERVAAKEAAQMGADIARALQAAARAGLVHQDIKPSNILITPSGAVKLADLGLAKYPTVVAGCIGTPFYMPPEQCLQQPSDVRSDIYGLGAVLYHAVTGSPPFLAPSPVEILQAHLTKPLEPARVRNPAVPQVFSNVLDKMLAKNASDRYQTLDALISDLEAFQNGRLVTTGRRPAVAALTTGLRRTVEPRPPARAIPKSVFIGLGVAAAAAVVLLLAWLAAPDPKAREAQNRLNEANLISANTQEALLKKKQILTSILSDIPARPATQAHLDAASAELAKVEAELLRVELERLQAAAGNADDIRGIEEARTRLRLFKDALAGRRVPAEAKSEAAAKTDRTIADLDAREQQLVEADRARREHEELARQRKRAEDAAGEVRTLLLDAKYETALDALREARAELKHPQALKILDDAERQVRKGITENYQRLLAAAEGALARGQFDEAQRAYKEIEGLGFDEHRQAAQQGLAKVAATRTANEQAAAQALKARYDAAVEQARQKVQNFDFAAAATLAREALPVMQGQMRADLETRGAVYEAAASGFQTLIDGINSTRPRVSVAVITPGMQGVIDRADRQAYFVQSKDPGSTAAINVRNEWTALKPEQLVKLGNAVFVKTPDRLNWACLAALLGQPEAAADIINDIARHSPEKAEQTSGLLKSAGLLAAAPAASTEPTPTVATTAPTGTPEPAAPASVAGLSPEARRDLDEVARLWRDGRTQLAANRTVDLIQKYAGTPDFQLLQQEVARLRNGVPGQAEAPDAKLKERLGAMQLDIVNGRWSITEVGTIRGNGELRYRGGVGNFALQLDARIADGAKGFRVLWRTDRLGRGYSMWVLGNRLEYGVARNIGYLWGGGSSYDDRGFWRWKVQQNFNGQAWHRYLIAMQGTVINLAVDNIQFQPFGETTWAAGNLSMRTEEGATIEIKDFKVVAR